MIRRCALFFVAALLASSSAYGKRTAPPEVAPITFGGITYSTPHGGGDVGTNQNGGYTQARDSKTGKLLWQLRVYEIQYEPNLEKDVQAIFISSLKIVDGNLEAVNERGDKFVVDLTKRRVIQGANRVYRFLDDSPRTAAGTEKPADDFSATPIYITVALLTSLWLARKVRFSLQRPPSSGSLKPAETDWLLLPRHLRTRQ